RVEAGPGWGVAQGPSPFRGASSDGLLERIKLADPAQSFGGDWRAGRLVQVVELTACVCPTGGQHDLAPRGQPLESGVTVNLQNAAESFEMRGWPLRLAVGAVKIDGGRRIGPAPGPVVARIDPQSAHLGAAAAGIEHWDRRIVGKDLARPEDVSGETRVQGLQPPARATDPVRQGRAVNLDAVPGENLALTVERGVVAIFAHQHMSQQAGGRQTFSDRPLGCRSLVDRAAATAAVLRPTNAQYPQSCRDEVEHLADRLADCMKRTATAGAYTVLDIEFDILPRQMVGKRRPPRRGFGIVVQRDDWMTYLCPGDIGV